MRKIFPISTICAAIAIAGMIATPASAKSGVKVGTLACNVSGGIGLIITSKKTMRCTLHKVSGRTENYKGTIRKFGLDIGVSGKAKMVWVVFAPGKTNRGALRGTYVGASANAAVGIGAGANVLVGGFNKSITLQPVSVQAQTGLNVAAGVSSLELY